MMSFWSRHDQHRNFSFFHFQDNQPALAYTRDSVRKPMVRMPMDKDGGLHGQIDRGVLIEDGNNWRHNRQVHLQSFYGSLLGLVINAY